MRLLRRLFNRIVSPEFNRDGCGEWFEIRNYFAGRRYRLSRNAHDNACPEVSAEWCEGPFLFHLTAPVVDFISSRRGMRTILSLDAYFGIEIVVESVGVGTYNGWSASEADLNGFNY